MALVTKIAEHRTPESDEPVAVEIFALSGVPNDRPRLLDRISGKIETARKGASENLDLLVPAHIAKGGLRNGTIVRDGIETLVRAAVGLIDEILDEFGPRPWAPDLIQSARESVVGFIEFLDSELDRFAQRVEIELECKSGPNGIVTPARRLWSESRNKLIDELEHRIENSCENNERPPAVADVAGDEAGDEGKPEPAATPDKLPAPGFALGAELTKSEPNVSMKSLVLGGQPVDRIRFEPDEESEPKPKSAVEAAPDAKGDWFEAWADVIVEICNGSANPRKQPEWRKAFEKACARHQIEADSAMLDEWSNLVWRKLITGRFLLSGVQKDIREEAERAAGREDYLPIFVCPAPASGAFSASFGARPIDGISASWLVCPDAASKDGAGESCDRSGQRSGPVHDLSTDLGLAVPMAQIDY